MWLFSRRGAHRIEPRLLGPSTPGELKNPRCVSRIAFQSYYKQTVLQLLQPSISPAVGAEALALSPRTALLNSWIPLDVGNSILTLLAPFRKAIGPSLRLLHTSSESPPAIMSSLSPDQIEGGASQASTEGTDKGVLSSLNLNFFKNLSDKKVTRTGNPPKRRGPKPDSKPALTRRQELNRQAQRTHRERKELYIKALEDEVIRLKEVFSTISLDKQKLYDENKQLKEVLAQRGIQLPKLSGVDDSGISATQAMSVSASGNSFATGSQSGFSPADMSQSTGMSMSPENRQPSPTGNGVDLEQAGIDFVLTYENSSSKAYLSPPPQ
ncbi:uncharacterized protein TrAFT101_003438 [Trichoderma asperellum]|uniref:uncharacterized protein n=1 Tax=Trichoderma asperellum TaxID=101201 RepID=UPI00331C2A2C|nr:hypothetical protein TrAFT101_003438 [Trichoderma asperellum]